MKQRFSSLPLVFAYYGSSSIFLFWKVDSFAKDVLVAPLYLIVPGGIGLLILSLNHAHWRLQDWLTRPQLALSGVFVGFVAISLLHQELERTRTLETVFPWLFPALGVLSLLGYYRSRQLLSIDATAWKSATKTLLLLLPFAAFTYYFHYLFFSSFPLRDVFQETHFMKGALELSRTQLLNPYITASYLPFIQLLLGQLNHFYGLDLMNANWILPAYVYFFHLACYAVFFSSLLRERRAFRLALVLATALAPMFYIENMIMQESMLLLLFSMLVREGPDRAGPMGFWSMLALLGSLFIAYYFYFNYTLTPPVTALSQPPARYTGMWAMAAAVFVAVVLQKNADYIIAAFLALFATSAFGMHRGILLFLPMILFAAVAYHLMTAGKTAIVRGPRMYVTLIGWLLAGAVLVFATALAFWFRNRYELQDAVANDASVSSGIAQFLLNTTKIEGGGTGFGHSLVESLRLFPPLPVFATLGLLVWFLFFSGRRLSAAAPQERQTAVPDDGLKEVACLVLVIAVLAAVSLSGIPYVYRGAFFPAVFGAALFAFLASRYASEAESTNRWRTWLLTAAVVVSAYLLTGLFYLYSPSRSLLGDWNAYLDALRPWLIAIFCVGLLLSGLLFLWRHSHKVAVNIVLLLTASAVVFDAAGFRTLFYEKAYGKELPPSRVISHYTALDLDLGRELRNYPAKTILISDPYTLSILRGVSGLNSVYSFANINLVSDADKYKNLFRFIAALGEREFSKAKAGELFAHVLCLSASAAAEGMYLWNREHIRHAKMGNLVSVDDIYRYFVWVINAKTFRWAMGEDAYYPDDSPIPGSLVSRLQDYFDIEKDIDGRLLVMRLKRQPTSVTTIARPQQLPQSCVCPPPLQGCSTPGTLKQDAGNYAGE
jgi:hypothetical protein